MHLKGGGTGNHYLLTLMRRYSNLYVSFLEGWKKVLSCNDNLFKSQVRLMCSYCKRHDETEVPDPYYGGPQGFEKVM